MSLEGSLRDVTLPEVCQLLALTRKSGRLRIRAPLSGQTGMIMFDTGAIIGAAIVQTQRAGSGGSDANQPGSGTEWFPDVSRGEHMTPHAVEAAVLELLAWREGVFGFTSETRAAGTGSTDVRLNTELILVEGTRQMEAWKAFAERIPHARVVPAFVDVDAAAPPRVSLTPQQWEVLAHVDGERDLQTLAVALGRNVLSLAATVDELLAMGLLKLAVGTRTLRAQPTPPSTGAIVLDADAAPWVPRGSQRARGDHAMRRGKFSEAIAHWQAALGDDSAVDDVAHSREALALALRLQVLLTVSDSP